MYLDSFYESMVGLFLNKPNQLVIRNTQEINLLFLFVEKYKRNSAIRKCDCLFKTQDLANNYIDVLDLPPARCW